MVECKFFNTFAAIFALLGFENLRNALIINKIINFRKYESIRNRFHFDSRFV